MPAYIDEKGRRATEVGDGTVIYGSLVSAAPAMVKRLLSQTNHIVIHTRKQGRGSGTRHVLERGEIVFSSLGGSKKGEPSPAKV